MIFRGVWAKRMTAEFLSSALVGHSSAAPPSASALGQWSQQLYGLLVVRHHLGHSEENHFLLGTAPPCSAESRWTLLQEGAIYFGRLSTSRAPGLEDVVFLPEKAETEDLAELLWSSHVTFLLDFPLNLLSSLSWWWYLNLADHFQHWIANV